MSAASAARRRVVIVAAEVPMELAERLRQEARRTDRSLSALLRDLVRAHFDGAAVGR